MRRQLTVKEFNNIIEVLKKIKRMGNGFIVTGGTFIITELSEKLVGKHYVQNDIFEVVLPYQCSDVTLLIQQLEEIKGKKVILYYDVVDLGVFITVNNITVKVATLYENDIDVDYTSIVGDQSDWVNVPMIDLEKMKSNQYITMSEGKCSIRAAKSLFQELGPSKVIKHKIRYKFKPINGYTELSMMLIEVSFDNIKILHQYTCVNYIV